MSHIVLRTSNILIHFIFTTICHVFYLKVIDVEKGCSICLRRRKIILLEVDAQDAPEHVTLVIALYLQDIATGWSISHLNIGRTSLRY